MNLRRFLTALVTVTGNNPCRHIRVTIYMAAKTERRKKVLEREREGRSSRLCRQRY